jgi:hypothetical protein
VVNATLKASVAKAELELFSVFERAMKERSGSFAALEAQALQLANEMVRRFLEAELRRMAARYETEILVDGQRYRLHSSGTRKYHSLCGALEVRRALFRLVGVHNGVTVVPLELEAGLMENATPALAASVLEGFATMPLRHYEDEMKAAHRRVPTRSTLERIGKRIGNVIRDQVHTIEPLLRAHEKLPDGAHSISVGIDRTTIPMAEPLGTPAPKKKRVRRRPKPVAVHYRMAYVATLAINDRSGEALKSFRFAAAANEGPSEILERLGEELHHVYSQRRLPVVVIQDGAPELWNLIENWLADHGIKAAAKLIDRYHLEERLAATCEVIEHSPLAARKLFNKWCRDLDRSDVTMPRICHKIERLVHGWGDDALPWPEMPPKLRGFGAHIAGEHLKYFRNCKGKLHYARARRRGFPVGSGVTEGACESVVAIRFKRSGQRWSESGVSPCVHVRTLHLNGRLHRAFEHLVEERRNALYCG